MADPNTDLRITHEQAAESALRFINAYFDNPDRTRPQIRIPRDPTDDDAVLMAYIKQQQAAQPSSADLEKLAREIAQEVNAMEMKNFGGRNLPPTAIQNIALQLLTSTLGTK